jgi:HAD superfamily hydrolase (TIGR01509 family)
MSEREKRPLSPFDLVIFDCDGVLIDSEVISTQTLLETLRTHGLEVDLAYVRRTYLGRSISVVKEDYLRCVGHALADTFEADFLERLFEAYRRDLTAMAGIKDLLGNLSVPYCMATSSNSKRALLSLELTGLRQYFENRIFYASMVQRGKPAPDLFLHAARTLNAEPARSLVIEDSEVGVLAARNAGMVVWRFVGGSHFRDPSDITLDESAEIPMFGTMAEVAAALPSALEPGSGSEEAREDFLAGQGPSFAR